MLLYLWYRYEVWLAIAIVICGLWSPPLQMAGGRLLAGWRPGPGGLVTPDTSTQRKPVTNTSTQREQVTNPSTQREQMNVLRLDSYPASFEMRLTGSAASSSSFA